MEYVVYLEEIRGVVWDMQEGRMRKRRTMGWVGWGGYKGITEQRRAEQSRRGYSREAQADQRYAVVRGSWFVVLDMDLFAV